MKTIEMVIRRVFFYGAFVLVAIAVLEKITNLFRHTLLGGSFTPTKLLEFASIGLLFSIAMQLHQIRILLSSKSPESLK
jgi:preprotein translocase subunit SecY